MQIGDRYINIYSYKRVTITDITGSEIWYKKDVPNLVDFGNIKERISEFSKPVKVFEQTYSKI